MTARFEAARAFSRRLAGRLDLNTVVLDDWRGVRLIYETADVVGCAGACRACATFRVLGAENPGPAPPSFRTTLLPVPADLAGIAPQPMLSCKRMEDYRRSFVHWFSCRCFSDQDLRDEADLVLGFRVVYHRGPDTETGFEANLKAALWDEVRCALGPERWPVVEDHLTRRGLSRS